MPLKRISSVDVARAAKVSQSTVSRVFTPGVPVSDETLALDMMNRVGPGGHYLNEEHTLQHYMEMWYSDLFDRSIYQTWLERGAKGFDERLRNKTAKLMKHHPKPLPEDVSRAAGGHGSTLAIDPIWDTGHASRERVNP